MHKRGSLAYKNVTSFNFQENPDLIKSALTKIAVWKSEEVLRELINEVDLDELYDGLRGQDNSGIEFLSPAHFSLILGAKLKDAEKMYEASTTNQIEVALAVIQAASVSDTPVTRSR